MKRKTANRRLHHRNVLEVRVMSPRIAWFGLLRFFAVLAKLACLAAVLTGIGWGVWRGIHHAFYQNPDFRLRVIDLNPNPVIDEPGLRVPHPHLHERAFALLPLLDAWPDAVIPGIGPARDCAATMAVDGIEALP